MARDAMAGYDAQDSRHRQELTELYNFQAAGLPAPGEAEDALAEDARMSFPAEFSGETVRRQGEWFLRNQVQLNSLASFNFAEAAGRFKDFFDIGNPRIDVITRVYFFITTIQFPPSNPLLFRVNLGPQSAFEMTNNYSTTLALAYEFMDTVATHPDDYCHFVKSLINFVPQNLTTNVKQHVGFWPFWAVYKYPCLLNTAPVAKSGLLVGEPFPPKPIDKLRYRCATPGCKRKFRHRFLLFEHNSTGGCGLSEQEKAMLVYSKPHIVCPFKPCSKSFRSGTGFRAHFKQLHQFPDDSPAAEPSADYACPFCPEPVASEDHLRCHISYHHLK